MDLGLSIFPTLSCKKKDYPLFWLSSYFLKDMFDLGGSFFPILLLNPLMEMKVQILGYVKAFYIL